MAQSKKNIELRSSKTGFVIQIKKSDILSNIENQIVELIKSNNNFFKGTTFIDVSAPEIILSEREELKKNLEEQFEIEFRFLKEKPKPETKKVQRQIENSIIEEVEKPTKFIKSTVRSGSRIEFEGNIVIIGDVNPGAHIIAKGNIIVMGYLRGIAHAGSHGDKQAFVAALRLNPIQLRIGTLIAISPEGKNDHNKGPEIAYINEDSIVIDSYPTKA